MSKVSEFPDRLAIEEEAGAWIIKLDGDEELNHHQRQAFKEWMSRSPAHLDEVKSLARFWGRMNLLTELAIPQPAFDTLKRRGAGKPFLQVDFRSKLALASCFLCLAMGISLWLQSGSQNKYANGLYATEVGQQKTINLRDGSLLQLNTNSRARVDYTDRYRDISLLQGEAHFTVAKNVSRPFRVSAGHGLVQAVGTAFSVYLNNGEVEVTTTEGIVGLQSRQLTRGAQNIVADNMVVAEVLLEHDLGKLKAGQSAIIKDTVSDNGAEPLIEATIEDVSPQELERKLSWRKGFITFNGEPLSLVVKELARYSGVSIELTTPEMASIKIGGQFRVGETDALFESLESNFGMKVKHVSDNSVQISYFLKNGPG